MFQLSHDIEYEAYIDIDRINKREVGNLCTKLHSTTQV